jgi:ABC-type polysaccharide/polyol phosphate transport system ATPase subunit
MADVTQVPEASTDSADPRDVAIQVRGLHKEFEIPMARPRGAGRSRMRGMFSRTPHRTLHALDDVSFEIRRGEFFGIVGRNGSGKSTLLKVIAGIYGADAGVVRTAGRVAPIIDLGVGFHPELTARDNVELNGVMLGLTPQQVTERFDDIIAMAELGGFADLKLRNYSTGMRMRLAFSILAEVEADILLIDEVLAVGDDAFRRRCEEVFDRLIANGTTIVLIAHQMSRIQRLCDRAMVLEGGRIDHIGDPGEVARRYVEINIEHGAAPANAGEHVARETARIADLWFENGSGERVHAVLQNADLTIHAEIEAVEDLDHARFRFEIRNRDRGRIFATRAHPLKDGDQALAAGERVHVEAAIENRMAPGSYTITAAVSRQDGARRARASDARTAAFAVVGQDRLGGGILALDHEMRVRRIGTEPLKRPGKAKRGRPS